MSDYRFSRSFFKTRVRLFSFIFPALISIALGLAVGCTVQLDNGIDSSLPDVASQSVSPLTEDERNIAEALITILHCMMNDEYQEYPEIYSYENAIVEATYMEGYYWYNPDIMLSEMAPEGITCFLRIPLSQGDERSPYEPIYYIFYIGRNADGNYRTDFYINLPAGTESVGMYFENFLSEYRPSPDSLHEFEFYFPPRKAG